MRTIYAAVPDYLAGSVIAHHGVMGQKRHVRRYQNYDGSYTPLGRIHYGIGKEDGDSSTPRHSATVHRSGKTYNLTAKKNGREIVEPTGVKKKLLGLEKQKEEAKEVEKPKEPEAPKKKYGDDYVPDKDANVGEMTNKDVKAATERLRNEQNYYNALKDRNAAKAKFDEENKTTSDKVKEYLKKKAAVAVDQIVVDPLIAAGKVTMTKYLADKLGVNVGALNRSLGDIIGKSKQNNNNNNNNNGNNNSQNNKNGKKIETDAKAKEEQNSNKSLAERGLAKYDENGKLVISEQGKDRVKTLDNKLNKVATKIKIHRKDNSNQSESELPKDTQDYISRVRKRTEPSPKDIQNLKNMGKLDSDGSVPSNWKDLLIQKAKNSAQHSGWLEEDILIHSGVKGQKWHVRRYQNADGTHTAEGRRHAQELYYAKKTAARVNMTDTIQHSFKRDGNGRSVSTSKLNVGKFRNVSVKVTAKEGSENDASHLATETIKKYNSQYALNGLVREHYSKSGLHTALHHKTLYDSLSLSEFSIDADNRTYRAKYNSSASKYRFVDEGSVDDMKVSKRSVERKR